MIVNAKIVDIGANPKKYHAYNAGIERGSPEFLMASGHLRVFGACPSRWKSGYEFPGSKATEWGSALDCWLLTPDQFTQNYSVKPETYPAPEKHAKVVKGEIQPGDPLPWNSNATICSDWEESQADKEIISTKLFGEIKQAATRIMEDDILRSFIESSDKQVWIKAEWHSKESGISIPIQVLIDLVPRSDTEWRKCAGDFKTTKNAESMAWQRWCYQAGYHIQSALYLDVLAAATKEDRCESVFVLSENYAPWQPARRMLSQDFLTLGREEYTRLLDNYCRCVASGKWPGYDDHDEAVQGWTLVAPEPWMSDKAAFAPNFDFGTDEAASEVETITPDDDIIP